MATSDGQLEFSGVSRTDEPTEHMARMISMLVILLRDGVVSFDWYYQQFERAQRSFARDLKHLRAIGSDVGFAVSIQREGRARLLGFAGANRLADGSAQRAAVLHAIAQALGAPVSRELGLRDATHQDADPFLQFAIPTLVEGSAVAAIFEPLRDAQRKRARVRFRYPRGRGSSERIVEPYRVLVRSGRYYLIGFDCAPRKGWRYFALDRIAPPVDRAGTFRLRTLPPVYADGDAIGMLQGSNDVPVAVTIRLSVQVAASATSRQWQKSQRVVPLPDGPADITLTVSDLGEAVRWALGYGAEARVIAPPAAVAAARSILEELRDNYGIAPSRALA